MIDPKKTQSGEYAAVKAYRKKLQSITDGALCALNDLSDCVNEDERTRSEAPPPIAPSEVSKENSQDGCT
jgi:hypothetical protein